MPIKYTLRLVSISVNDPLLEFFGDGKYKHVRYELIGLNGNEMTAVLDATIN